MAQNNKPNGGMYQKKFRDNYFKKELQQYRGSAPINFMANKNAKQRNKDCKSICIDMANGNIDVAQEAGYFLQPELLDQLCSFTWSKYYYHSFVAEAASEKITRINMTMGPSAVNRNAMFIVDQHARSAEAYRILYNGFSYMKASGDATGWLTTMISQLSAGKYAPNI